jgi:hypothetical protein
MYFVLSYRHQDAFRTAGGGSYMYSQTDITGAGGGGQRPGLLRRIAPWALAGGAAAGVATLMSRRNRRSESRDRVDQTTEITENSRRTSRPGSESFIEEKFTDHGRHTHTWRDRLLGATAGIGLFEGARRILGGRQRDEDYSDVSYDRPTQSGFETETDIRRVEEGRPPASPAAGRTRQNENLPPVPAATASPSRRSALRARKSGGSIYSYDSALSHNSPGRDKRRNHTLRDGIAALGVGGYIRHKLNQRRDRREDQRISDVHDRDRQEERVARMNSARRRYTGDGTPSRVRRHSVSESDLSPISGSNPALSRHSLPRPAGGAAGSRHDIVSNPNLPTPPPFTHATPQPSPAPPQDRHRLRDAAVPLAAGAAGVAAGAALGAAVASDRRASSRRRESVGDQASPPVSLKMKMHNDGRHVTLRRLDPAEAAAERDRRRRDRTGSFSSVGGGEGDEHWRRTERREAAEAAEMQRRNVMPGPPPGPPPVVGNNPLPPEAISGLPPPPPIPAASGITGSPGSGADSSAVGSRAESNRRRRRIERARADSERRSNRVDFT